MKANQEKFNALKAKAETTTSSGLQYIITEKGKGSRVTTTNKVSTHIMRFTFRGWHTAGNQ